MHRLDRPVAGGLSSGLIRQDSEEEASRLLYGSTYLLRYGEDGDC